MDLKPRLTCPKCGQTPVMSPSGKMWLFSFRSKHPCPMLPPAMISMPFKLLLFVTVDGWELLFSSIVQSFR